MKMNRTSAAAAVIAAGLVASLGALAPATVNADELTAAAPAATQSADAEDPAADAADDAVVDADVTPSDDAAVAAVSAVALSTSRLPPPPRLPKQEPRSLNSMAPSMRLSMMRSLLPKTRTARPSSSLPMP